MNPLIKILGVTLIFTAVIGILFSLVALVGLWSMLPTFTQNVQANVRLIGDALQTTSDGLAIAEHSLETSISSITTLETTVEATARSIKETTPMVDSLVALAGEDLPETVSTAQVSLVAARESAEIIDGVLSFLAGLPLVPDTLYNPPVPLHIALDQVSQSLENVPPALETMESSLLAAGVNMETIEADFTLIAADIREINTSMVEAQGVVDDYHVLVNDLLARVDRAEANMPGWINAAALVLTFLLVWAAISQVGLLMQGLSMVGINAFVFPEQGD